jgi:hypothetical protein
MRRLLTALCITGLTALALVAAACGDDSPDESPGPSPTPGRTTVDAPIDELELIIRESFPPQYAARVVSGIPSGCENFKEATLVSKDDNIFVIKVTNTRIDDPNAVCTAIYGTHESIIELGSDLVSGEEYTIKANDRSLTFTAQ